MLALIGSGEYQPEMEAVDRELIRRLPEPVRVVCLPTAAGQEGEERITYWSQLGIKHFTGLGVHVEALPVIDRASAHNARLAQAITEANFIYLSGGKPGYLHQTLDNSPVWQAIQSVLARGGLLAGCSAGAMVLGKKYLDFPFLFLKAGFNAIPGSLIMPHYDEIGKSQRAVIHGLAGAKLTLLGVEANTALVIAGAQADVVGSGGVTIWDRTGATRYLQGPLPVSLPVIDPAH
jgi:cyanophycinase